MKAIRMKHINPDGTTKDKIYDVVTNKKVKGHDAEIVTTTNDRLQIKAKTSDEPEHFVYKFIAQ